MFGLTKLFGQGSSRWLAKQESLVGEINALEAALAALPDEGLRGKTAEFKNRLPSGVTLGELLPEAFAVVREAAKRTLGQRHFDVQLLGGLALHQGKIAEMRTGEGKTLVATLPAYLNALVGRGVHIITVNDFLARRDAVWMGQIYAFLGLSVGVVNNNDSYLYDPAHKEVDPARDERGGFHVFREFLKPCAKREAYAADITYGTNNEFGFDYLRDNIAYRSSDIVERHALALERPYFAIIDEVDSILIDEARTPLIISAPAGQSEKLYQVFAKIAARLEPTADFTVDEKHKAIQLTETGIDQAEKLLGLGNLYTEGGIKYVHHLETALRAKALFLLDRDYVVRDGEAVIVDEFTGRLQPGRRWSEGLHQAIEAKEGVEVRQESRTLATISFQNLFRLYEKIAGMTGTAATSSEEFLRVYGLEVIAIPPNQPSQRRDDNDLIFQTEAGKFKAIARQVKKLNQAGQPVLIGTVSIEKNELLGAYLKREGVPHEILNAKNHEREGEIIAGAGAKASVVLATNLAGRGVDIKLGGKTATSEQADEVKKLGGLFVLGTERHEARRIDNQLRGRSGRQGDPGATQFFVSMEDSLMRVFGSDRIKNMMARLGIPEDEPIENRLVTKAIASAQEKIEGLNFDLRKHLLEYDDVMNHQRQTIYERRRQILFGDGAKVEAVFQGILSDSGHNLGVLAPVIEEKKKLLGETGFYQNLRQLLLQVIDLLWMEHLEVMDYLRGSVRLRAYGQRDPLVEYKKEGLRLYKDMEQAIGDQVINLLPNIGTQFKQEQAAPAVEVKENVQAFSQPTDEKASNQSAANNNPNQFPKVGRNDPCPCGSGKKYKKCHGK